MRVTRWRFTLSFNITITEILYSNIVSSPIFAIIIITYQGIYTRKFSSFKNLKIKSIFSIESPIFFISIKKITYLFRCHLLHFLYFVFPFESLKSINETDSGRWKIEEELKMMLVLACVQKAALYHYRNKNDAFVRLNAGCTRVCSLFNRNRELRVVYVTVGILFRAGCVVSRTNKAATCKVFWSLV